MVANRFSISIITLSLLVAGCGLFQKTAIDGDIIVGEVAGEPVLISELKERFYQTGVRSVGDLSAEEEKAELQEFLPLYMDYRAKLVAAREAGYYQMDEILTELRTYETQTAYPYWLNNKIKEQLLDELVERAAKEVNVSHMLITLDNRPSQSDVDRAISRLEEARSKALLGEDFDSLSVVYSSMRQGRTVGGALGYITAGWAVKEFEDVAYNTGIGEVSEPFRTQFGYHIVKVHDVRPVVQDRKVSHVFFQSQQDLMREEALEAAQEAYQLYLNGERTWNELVTEFSQDPQSVPSFGQLGWVNNGRLRESSIDTSFTGPIMRASESATTIPPYYSGYGVHIVRIDSIRTYTSDQQLRDEMYTRLRNLPRYRDNQSITRSAVREAGNERIYMDNIRTFEAVIPDNSGRGFSRLEVSDDVLNLPVYTINDNTYLVSDYLNWIHQSVDTSSTNNYNVNLRERFFDDRAEAHIVPITRNVFPEFARLSQLYLDGLVLFKVSEDSVWNFSRTDTVNVRAIYDENPDRFRFPDRYFYYRIAANNDSTLTVAIEAIRAGVPVDSLRNDISNLLVRSDVINDLTVEPFNYLQGLQEGEISERFDFRNRRTVLKLDRIEPARTMTFDEAYFRAVSEYQPIREENWNRELRERYNVRKFPDRIPKREES